MRRANRVEQRCAVLHVAAIAGQMNARQHHLFESRFRKALRLCRDFINRAGADRPAHRRNDAVCTPAVAAFLNLHRRAGMSLMRMHHQVFKRRFAQGFDGDQRAILRHRLFQQLDNLAAPLGAQHKPHAGQGQFIGRTLGKASGHDNLRQRVLAMAAADDLHALFIARSRHGTGIDNIDIGPLVKFSRAVARLFKPFAHGLRIVLVHLTSKGMKGDCFLF